jgi:hypothetical protein
MKTKIIALAALVLAVGALLVLNERRAAKAEVSDLNESWAVFESYRAAAKDKDLDKLREVAYQISATCQDEAQRAECDKLMEGVYNFIKDYRQEEFSLLGRDRKQVILATPYFYALEGEAPSATRAVLYFVRNEGKLNFLSVNPFQGTIVLRNDEATSTVEAMIEEMIADTDKDGMPDKTERCEDNTPGVECVKTNPNRRDTNGNGWWDSIESLFYR